MSPRKLTLAGVAGALALAGTSSGGYTGLAATLYTAPSSGGSLWDTYRLYATFDNSADSVVAVGGTPGVPQPPPPGQPPIPQTLETGGGGFFQATIFGTQQNGPQSQQGEMIPNMHLDSFLTIGVPQFFVGNLITADILFFNTGDFNGGASTVVTTDGGWFQSPDAMKTFAKPYPPPNASPASGGDGVYCGASPGGVGGDWGVLIGQFTVATGNTFSGDLGVLAVYAGGAGIALSGPAVTFSFNVADLCPLGACCLPTTECIEDQTEVDCTAMSGVFLGQGTQCIYAVFQVNHEGPMDEWSHSFELIVDCPSGTDGPGCTAGPVKIDAWQTTPMGGGSSNCENFHAPTACMLPGGFFGPGSDPWPPPPGDPDETGVVCFDGEPLGTVTIPGFPPLDFGDTDTLVTRPNDPFDRCELPSANTVVVPIQIEQLNLVSQSPITVKFGGANAEAWDVRVRVDGSSGQPAGSSLTATKTHCNGGTFDSTLSVCPKFVFTKVDPPFTEIELDYCAMCNPVGIMMNSNDLPWVHETTGILDVMNPVCTDFVPGITETNQLVACDCNVNTIRDKCDIEDGTSFDCNLNGIPDECEVPAPCAGDLNENCDVDFADILLVIAAWGPCPPECPEDLDSSGEVGFSDILAVIGNWGPCDE